MATDDQYMMARRGGGQMKTSATIALTMAAGATVSGSFTPPAGSRVSAMRSYTPTAISGSPTNINLTVGKTAGGQEYVATVDKKAANANDLLTLVAAPDYASWPSGQAIIAQIAAVGGTNPAGTVNVEVDFSPANP
jgi:hypothetical protein